MFPDLRQFKGQPVAVAMSGGVDSSMVAALLVEAGAQVHGLTMKLWRFGDDASVTADSAAVVDARAVAATLGIPHHVVDLREPFFTQVIQPFADAYAAGRTPSPCMVCNPLIKFGALLDASRAIGCERMATGHYVRLELEADGTPRLRRGVDPNKDQAYFLARVPREKLAQALFPLGEQCKPDVVRAAMERGILRRDSTESQDLCFLPNGAYADLVAQFHPELLRAGEIVTANGKVLGQHDGFFRYTCGQRRGLGLGGGPWYVLRVEPQTNRVVVGSAAEAEARSVRLAGMNWLVPPPPAPLPVQVQLRYKMKSVPATATLEADGTVSLALVTPVVGVAPGQGGVLSDGERILGGGWIA